MKKNIWKEILINATISIATFSMGGLIGLAFLSFFNNSLWSLVVSLPVGLFFGYGVKSFQDKFYG